MPKRKHNNDDYDYFKEKIKRLERKLDKVNRKKPRSPSPAGNSPPAAILLDSPSQSPLEEHCLPDDMICLDIPPSDEPTPVGAQDQSAALLETVTEHGNGTENNNPDTDLLEILGEDPTISNTYGKDIQLDLAKRLEHITTSGLSKEIRKELNERYLVPGNCKRISPPLMNDEIKAAVTDVVTKRDKGIEMRQKQLAAAIAGISNIISMDLQSKEKDKDRLKKMMDVSRILCDIQHAESVTRRNFAIFSIKKDLKDHLANTKIDKYLFGENLSETLKAAKTVNKSGSELKTRQLPKPQTITSNSLNWKGQGPARRPPGPPRGREPVAPAKTAAATTTTARFPRRAPPAAASKTSQPLPRQSYRR